MLENDKDKNLFRICHPVCLLAKKVDFSEGKLAQSYKNERLGTWVHSALTWAE